MAENLVKAEWNGPYEGDRGPGIPPLQFGDVAEVTPALLESGHWRAVEEEPAPTPAPAKPVTPANPRAEGAS